MLTAIDVSGQKLYTPSGHISADASDDKRICLDRARYDRFKTMGDGDEQLPAGHRMGMSTKYWIVGVGAFISLLVVLGAILFLLISHSQTNQLAASFQAPQRAVDFPLYYPSTLPSYYFVDNGSIQANNDVVIFPISRNDGKKILVTEQSLPSGFSLSGINGLQHQLPGVGTVVIGSGFIGNRAVIETKQTVIFLSSPQDIPLPDLESITYSFRQLD